MQKFTYRKTTTITGTIIEENETYYFIEANNDIYSWEKELTIVGNIETKEAAKIIEGIVIRPNKYYIFEERQTAKGIEIKNILPITRSTRKLGYSYIEKNKLKSFESIHDLENGIQYAGQWYYNCRKGSTII